jgi:outer membrane protein assembly factor BamA
MHCRRYIYFFSSIFFFGKVLIAQPGINELPSLSSSTFNGSKSFTNDNNLFTIRKIYISGNRKTKENVILREIPFHPGEQYQLQDLVKKFSETRRYLMNTVLFHEVTVSLKSFEGTEVDILVEVVERWYIFPIPYFKIADRNFNQWIVESNASLSRTNYGVKLMFNNVTGRNDKLNLWIMNGYTRQLSFNYDRLYIDRQLKWGLKIGGAFGQNRELNYNTINDKQVFFKDSSKFIRSYFKAYAEATYRPAIHTRHFFGISINQETVGDTILALNPSYFTNGSNKILYPEFYYIMRYTNVDYIPYPLVGYTAEVSLVKKGVNNNMDMWQFSGKTSGDWKLFKKTYFGARVSGSVKLPFEQPYFNQRLFGYNDFFIQGYEYYVMDGVAGGYLKGIFTRELVNLHFDVRNKKLNKPYPVPFRIYAKMFGNAGYTYNPNPGLNTLNNRMLYSWGVGLDLITHYDLTIKLEWSFNHLGQNGLYLHRKSNF